MNDCFFSDSDAAMPRQTQADNDASGSPQRVAGRPPLLSVLATVLHLPMVGTWWSERLWDGPYGCAIPRQTQADNDALGSPQRVAGRPLGQPLRNRSQAMKKERDPQTTKNTQPTSLCVGDAQSLSGPTDTDHREVQDG